MTEMSRSELHLYINKLLFVISKKRRLRHSFDSSKVRKYKLQKFFKTTRYIMLLISSSENRKLTDLQTVPMNE